MHLNAPWRPPVCIKLSTDKSTEIIDEMLCRAFSEITFGTNSQWSVETHKISLTEIICTWQPESCPFWHMNNFTFTLPVETVWVYWWILNVGADIKFPSVTCINSHNHKKTHKILSLSPLKIKLTFQRERSQLWQAHAYTVHLEIPADFNLYFFFEMLCSAEQRYAQRFTCFYAGSVKKTGTGL